MQPSLDLDTEAKDFFATTSEKDREETRAFQSAWLRALARTKEKDYENYGT
jgi:hypothetical protein